MSEDHLKAGGASNFLESNPYEKEIALETLERYSGSHPEEFCSLVLLTNFSRYMRTFAKMHGVEIKEGSMFSSMHVKSLDITLVDFKLGSAAAALIVDLLSFLPKLKAVLLLGMCGGLRRHYALGNYFVPVASIRGEGTSDFYFPPEVPALANFLIQKSVTNVLNEENIPYHIGITHTTNIRFWEFNEAFRAKLIETKAQAIEMECATLFSASYRRKLPLGALLLISDFPLSHKGIKTKRSAELVFERHTETHLQLGVKVLHDVSIMLDQKIKGAFRGRDQKTDI